MTKSIQLPLHLNFAMSPTGNISYRDFASTFNAFASRPTQTNREGFWDLVLPSY